MTQNSLATTWRRDALAELETEIRGLLHAILASLTDLLESQDSVRRFIADAPVSYCVRLAETWAVAAEMGLNPAQMKPRFTPEEQFLIELVTAIYTAGKPSTSRDLHPDLSDLCDLVAELGEPMAV